jgi:hypothetical protein
MEQLCVGRPTRCSDTYWYLASDVLLSFMENVLSSIFHGVKTGPVHSAFRLCEYLVNKWLFCTRKYLLPFTKEEHWNFIHKSHTSPYQIINSFRSR